MNKACRTELDKIHTDATALLNRLDDLQSDEEESFNNMPEGLQNSDRGEQTQANADTLRQAKDSLETAIQSMQECIDYLESVE